MCIENEPQKRHEDAVLDWHRKLVAISVESDELVDTVLEAGEDMACSANNGGLESQVRFLLENDFDDELQHIYDILCHERANADSQNGGW